MKKLLLIALFAIGNLMCSYAQQNDTILYIENYQDVDRIPICVETYQRALIYAENGCNSYMWYVYGFQNTDNPVIIESNTEETVLVGYFGCDIPERAIRIVFKEGRVPNSFTHTAWKRNNETLTLKAVESDSLDYPFEYQFHWSTGETTNEIEVTETGAYTCEVIDACGTATRTFIVQDNVEVELATCDLESNLNLITWQTNPAQALYIDHVIVKRDGMQVGTAPYSDGQFTDNIGSGSASRTYTLTAVATDGTECPIVSYPKETIHMAYLTGINNTIEVNWNVPAGYDLLGYNICEWHPRKSRPSGGADPQNCGAEGVKDGDLTVIDFVGASVTSYTCSENQFNEGHVVVQGVENGKSESRLLSNRSEEGIVGIGEHQNKTFKLYPNPSNGEFTVEGTTDVTVFNTLGQVITTSHSENGTHQITVSSGIYFIKSDEGIVKKVVVE